MRNTLSIILSLVIISATFAADPPPAPAPPKLDTTRGDRYIAQYFQDETDDLAKRCLADIKSLDDWKAKRETYRKQLFEMLSLDPLPPKTDLKAKTTGTVDQEEYTVENIHFQSSPGLYVTGNLYIPKGLHEPAPTILYVCGHGGVKKNNISYGNKTYYTHHGSWFARHGYVCLTIDSLQLGEIEGIHHGTYRYGMWWWLNRGYTPAGVEAWNCIRALDYLETRKECDKTKFGVTGRSGGGAYSWWIAALDERIKVAVPGAGITDLTNHVVDGCVEGHCDCMYMHNTYRWDYAQVAALVAPRPLLISNTDKDTIFPLDGVNRIHEKVRDIYKLYGAEKSLGLNIVEGPHKDSQELQLGSFVWFDRFLKKEERVIEKAAVKQLQPEQLRVFEKLPEDQINTTIQETFFPAAPRADPPKDAAAWSVQRDAWLKALRERCFAGWPEDGGPLEVSGGNPVEKDGVVFRAYDFTSQRHVYLTLYVAHRADLEKPELVVLNVLDEQGWADWLKWSRGLWGKALEKELAVAPDDKAIEQNVKMLKNTKWAMAYVAPRGIGPTAWDQSEKKQVQHRRRYMLLGQTLDGMRVFDICRSVQALRDVPKMKGTPLWLQSERAMAGNALYASLFEKDIARLDLWHLPATHREGPIYMNVSRVLEMPQAVALAADRAQVRIYQEGDAGWDYVKATGAALADSPSKWDAKRFEVRTPPQTK